MSDYESFAKKLGLLIFLALMSLPLRAAATIYQSVNSQGNVVYSDQPSSNAQTVNLPQNQAPSVPSSRLPQTGTLQSIASSAQQTDTVYKTLNIQSPTNDQTIWDNSGNIAVSVTLQPALATTDTLQLAVDGQTVASSQTNTSFSLTGLDRGTHVLQARIVNQTQKVIKVSNTVTVYLHRTVAACNSPMAACPNGQCGGEISFLASHPSCQQNLVNKMIEVYQDVQACNGSCAKKVEIDTEYRKIQIVWIPQIQKAMLSLENTLEICKASSCRQLTILQQRYQLSQQSIQLFKSGIAKSNRSIAPASAKSVGQNINRVTT